MNAGRPWRRGPAWSRNYDPLRGRPAESGPRAGNLQRGARRDQGSSVFPGAAIGRLRDSQIERLVSFDVSSPAMPCCRIAQVRDVSRTRFAHSMEQNFPLSADSVFWRIPFCTSCKCEIRMMSRRFGPVLDRLAWRADFTPS